MQTFLQNSKYLVPYGKCPYHTSLIPYIRISNARLNRLLFTIEILRMPPPSLYHAATPLPSPCPTICFPWIYPSRKTNKLRIPRPTIRPNIILRKSAFGIYPPCFIKPHHPISHDFLNLFLA